MTVELGIGGDDDEPGIGSLWTESLSLVEALDEVVIVSNGRGQILYANPAVESLLGWVPARLVGLPVTTVIPERLRPAHQQAFDSFTGGGPPTIIGTPLGVQALTADGSETPIELLLSVLRRDDQPVVIATIRTVVGREGLERPSTVIERVLDVLADGRGNLGHRFVEVVGESLEWDVAALWAVEADGETIRGRHFWSRAGIDVSEFRSATESAVLTRGVGLPGRTLAGEAPVWIDDVQMDPNFARTAAAKAVGLRSGFAFPLRHGTQVIGVMELLAVEVREPDPVLLAAMDALGYRLGDLLAQAEDDRNRNRFQHEQQRVLKGQELLLRAARALAEAGGYTEALERLAAVAVPDLADLCLIDVLAEDGSLVRMASRHGDQAMQHLATELRSYPPDPNGPHPIVSVMQSHRSRASLHMSDQFLAAMTRNQRHLELTSQLRFTSYMCVPLVVEGRSLGAVTLVSAGSGRRFGESDLALAEELAGQAAAAIDRASRHDRERAAAQALQRSLLPDRLPDVAGIETAVSYIAGTEGADVGGDWYDVIPLEDGDVGLAIGDVAGHDMEAAALMGQLRNAMRAYAIRDGIPAAAVLDELRRFCEVLDISRIATAAYARLSVRTGQLRVASAGHPPPIILRVSGQVEQVDLLVAPPIGVKSGPTEESSVALGIGDTVVMFTDGLVERRAASIDDGIARLVTAMVSAGGHGASALCDQIVKRVVLDGGWEDDIALLVVRRVAG